MPARVRTHDWTQTWTSKKKKVRNPFCQIVGKLGSECRVSHYMVPLGQIVLRALLSGLTVSAWRYKGLTCLTWIWVNPQEILAWIKTGTKKTKKLNTQRLSQGLLKGENMPWANSPRTVSMLLSVMKDAFAWDFSMKYCGKTICKTLALDLILLLSQADHRWRTGLKVTV